MDWKLSEAKNRFSEVVRLALSVGPQRVRRRNETVVVLSEADYERLTGQRLSLKQMLLDGPSLEGVDLERDRSPLRDPEL